jgi:omega-hydroxy-beta-dihydromenaquinone-9 sulfotransferase
VLPPRHAVRKGMALAREARRRGRVDVHDACKRQVMRLRAVQAITALARGVDDVCYRGYRREEVRAPVFIAAPARSGTTLLFNLMARDPAFTCMKTYQTQLPAISIERLIRQVARLDRPLDGRLSRLLERMNAEVARFEHVHRTRLEEPEEDSGLFLAALVEPNVNLVFPFGHAMDDRWYLDDLPEPERSQVMDWYLGSLKRHLYDAPGRRLLVKNAHAAGRLASIRRALPDVRVINIARHPYQTVPSSVSLVVNGYRALARLEPDAGSPEWRAIADATIEYYRRLLRFEREFPKGQWITVRFDELVRNPLPTVERIYSHLGLPMTAETAHAIGEEAAASARHRSRGHSYTLEEFGLTREAIYEPLREVFEVYGFEP